MTTLGIFDEIDEIDGFDIGRMAMDEFHADHPIVIHKESNKICFHMQNGPVNEVGVNGCQVDTLIHAALHMIKWDTPSRENSLAKTKLQEALFWAGTHSSTIYQRKRMGD